MINPENYLPKIKEVDITNLPMPLQKGHEFLMKATNNATDWNTYHNSTPIRKTIQIYFERLNDFLPKTSKENKSKGSATAKQDENVNKQPSSGKPKKQKVAPAQVPDAIMVERIPEELRFIKRFINLDGKTKTKEEILRFINSLQKAIVERRIRKTSPYAEQVKYIQGKLIDVYNTMKAKIKLELKPETYESLKKLTGSEKVMASIGFIKRYISMNGKPGTKEKAKQLLQQINHAMDKGKITDNDPYIVEIHELKKNLKAFATDKSIKVLEIEQATLNGLEGILFCYIQHFTVIASQVTCKLNAQIRFTHFRFTRYHCSKVGGWISN